MQHQNAGHEQAVGCVSQLGMQRTQPNQKNLHHVSPECACAVLLMTDLLNLNLSPIPQYQTIKIKAIWGMMQGQAFSQLYFT